MFITNLMCVTSLQINILTVSNKVKHKIYLDVSINQ